LSTLSDSDDVAGDEFQERRPAVVDAPVGKRGAAIDGIERHAETEPAIFVGEIDDAREGQRQCDPHAGPGQRFTNRDDVRLAMKDSEIEGEQEKDEDKEGNPDDHHGLQAGGSLAGTSLLDWKRPEANASC
jgi:hypothetical protein